MANKFTSLVIVIIFSVVVNSTLFASAKKKTSQSKPDYKFLLHGAKKFAEHCAVCHGQIAQGAPNWHEPDASGNYPPPPLDGSGHTWHHDRKVLTMQIKKGGKPLGGVMPPFEHKLTDRDINAIIAWLQSHWPEKILETWRKNFGE